MASHPPRSRTTAPPKRVAPSAIPPSPLSPPQKRKSSAPKFFFAKTAQSRNFRRIILCIRQSIGASKIFKVTIQNFGKLTDAVVRIGKFTVFAGPNNTGKSFVSKALYSIFGAMNANHLDVLFYSHLSRMRSYLRSIDRDDDFQDNDVLEQNLGTLAYAVNGLRRLVNKALTGGDGDELSAIEARFSEISGLLGEIVDTFAHLKPELQRVIKARSSYAVFSRRDFDMRTLESMSSEVDALAALHIKLYEPMECIVRGLQEKIRENLYSNLQVGDLSLLCRDAGSPANFDIEGAGSFNIKAEGCGATISPKGLRLMQEHSGVLYLESSSLWRLKDALESVKNYEPPLVPGYFHDMLDVISRNYYPKVPKFSDVLNELTAEIGGRVFMNNTDDLIFQEEGGGNYPLLLAAMGVTNMGMLGLLIEKDLLGESTFLFVDEPEAHLHPAWQVAMTKVLIRLAEQGVKVVMATHSADILKWIEIYVKENPEVEDLFALNHFADGTVKSGDGFREELGGIMDDLTTPYQHMFIRGLRA